MNRRNTSPRNSGFSLIELTSAMSVISLGLFAVIHVYLQGIEKMRAIDEYETALCALNNEIETLRALSWDELEPGNALPFRSSTPGMARLHLAETQAIVTETDGLKEVRARIRWIGEHGRRIEKELVTLIARTDAAARGYTHWDAWEDDDDMP